MVVTYLHADRRRLSGPATCLDKEVCLELLIQEGVSIALIDQQIGQAGAILNQGTSVVFAPVRPVCPDIARQRLFAPRAGLRADDWGKGTRRADPARIAQ